MTSMLQVRSRKTHRHSARALFVIATAGVAVASGCHFFRSDDEGEVLTTRPSTTQDVWRSDQALPQALQPTNRPEYQSELPLLYLVESAANYRVTNVATGEEIITFAAKPPQIIRVESKGVLLENRPVIGAQLSPGIYAISKVYDADAGRLQVKQTLTRPVPGAAATKPAGPAFPPMNPAPVATPPPQ